MKKDRAKKFVNQEKKCNFVAKNRATMSFPIILKRMVFITLSFTLCILKMCAMGRANTDSLILQKQVSDSLYTIAVNAYNQHNYSSTIDILLFAQKKYQYIDSLLNRYKYYNMWIGCSYYKLGNINEAKKYNSRYYNLEPIDRRLTYETDSLAKLSNILFKEGKYAEAFKIDSLCVEKEKSVLGENSYWVANTINDCGLELARLNQYEEALKYIKKAYEIRIRILDEKHPDCLRSLQLLSRYYYEINDLQQAINWCEKELSVRMQISNNSKEYFACQNNLCIYYSRAGEPIKAIELSEKILASKTSVYGENSKEYLMSYGDLADYYYMLGNIDKALSVGNEVLKKKKNLLGDNDIEYALSLNSVSVYNAAIGNYSNSIKFSTEAARIFKEKLGESSSLYTTTISNLSAYYQHIGDFENGKVCALLASETIKRVYGERHIGYEQSLLHLGTIYSFGEEHQNAINIYKQIIALHDSLKQNEIYLTTLNNLATEYAKIRDYDNAIMSLKLALSGCERVFGSNHRCYANSLENMATIHSIMGNKEEALSCRIKANYIWNEINPDSYDYAQSLYNLAKDYYDNGNFINIHNTLNKSAEILRKKSINNFIGLTAVQRTNLWNSSNKLFFNIIPKITYNLQTSEMISLLYNHSVLFAKGILMNTDIELDRVIYERGNKEQKNLLNEYKENCNKLNKFQGAANDSLKQIINLQENRLKECITTLGGFILSNITWEDIRNTLREKEVAIEFVEVPNNNLGSFYIALTIRKDYKEPKLFSLFATNEIMGNEKEEVNMEKIYHFIWKSLKEEIADVSNLYLSPCGILNNIGIEYILEDSIRYKNKSCNIYRLSSTRELLKRKQKMDSIENTFLYGGLEYNCSSDTMLIANKHVQNRTVSHMPNNRVQDSIVFRSGFEPLHHTLYEVTEIRNILDKKNNVVLYEGEQGTEESFKLLSGKNVEIIHLATHGMYIPHSEKKGSHAPFSLLFIFSDEGDYITIDEQEALNRSFLVMARGNMLPLHKSVPDDMEDGLLTAYEISKMDLRHLDLVVLSACQTALGDINSEGVYGLQRGFKKAGANTIVMSLDKVNDEATKILMVEFYKNLMSGKTKLQSLKDAQKHLRSIENGKFDDPKFWASFIMLDGLN